jgi:GDP-D-mannose 3', 5'-epimerase
MRRPRATVSGAGGFIGHHMVKYLKASGYWVRAADIKYPEYEESDADEFDVLDLREWKNCLAATRDVDEVYQLAADMGGIGYITAFHADIARDNVLINAHMLEAAHRNQVERYFFASSACIYPMYRQQSPDVTPLKEEDAYPADPEDGYGWEKLFMERQCRHYREDYGLETRVVRFHNIYGELGTYEGGREKSPAALCRKIALVEPGGTIEIWGDGEQTRSYCYIDDCVEGIYRLMRSNYPHPLNLGTDRLVTINELADIIGKIAGRQFTRSYDLSKPQGVRGRNSDNSRLRQVLDWQPQVSLEDGLARTYAWIRGELAKAGRLPAAEIVA